MEIMLGWFIFSVVAGWIAANKGRSGVGVFFLSLLLSPLVGIIVALCMDSIETIERQKAESGRSDAFRKCPFCAEIIRREASKCRYCGSAVEPVPTQTRSDGFTATLTEEELEEAAAAAAERGKQLLRERGGQWQ